MLKQSYTRLLPTLLFVVSLSLVACGDSPAAVTTTTNAIDTPALVTNPPPVKVATVTKPPLVPTATPIGANITSATTKPTTGALSGKIVFDFESQIFVINPDGTGKTKIADGETPLFSPDGKRVAFAVMEGKQFGTPPAKYTIRSMNLDGWDKQDLCVGKDNYAVQLLRWSPRNRFIAVLSGRMGTDAFGNVALCNLTDKKITELNYNTSGPLAVYDWTPDGDNAVWVTSTDKSYDLLYGDPDKAGGGAVTVVKGQPLCNCGIEPPDFRGARFSPDGKTLAVINENKVKFVSVPGQKSLLDGKEISFSADQSFKPSRLSWSPDGQYLAVTVFEPQGKSGLRIVNLDEKQFGQSKTITENIYNLDWTR